MGLFSKTKTYYDSTTSLLMEGEPGDLAKDSVLASVIMDRPIASDLVANMIDGYGNRANYFYNYAKHNMSGAVPTSTHQRDYVDFEYVAWYLQNEYVPTITGKSPQPIEIDSLALESADPYLFTVRYLGEQQITMDPTTNKLPSAPSDSLNNTTANSLFYKDSEFTSTGKLSITLSVGAPGASVMVDTDPEEVILITVADYEPVDASETNAGEMYLYVAYKLKASGSSDPLNVGIGDMMYFYYRINSYTIKEISQSVTQDTGSDYFPIIPFITTGKKQTWIDANKESTDKATAKLWSDRRNLCKRLRLDYVNVGESLVGEPSDPNPNLPDVEAANINLSIPIALDGSKNMSANKYLFNYFDNLHSRHPDSVRFFEKIVEDGGGLGAFKNLLSGYGVEISDGQGYRVKLQWNFIEKHTVDGVVAPDAKIGDSTKVLHKNGYKRFGTGLFGGTYGTSEVVLQKQVSPYKYEELIISGLLHTTFIGSKALETDIGKALENHADPDIGYNFLIPLEVDTFQAMSMVDRNNIMYEAVRFSVSSKKTIKLKWYQRGFMKPLMIIVAVAIAWFTAGGAANFALAFIQSLAFNAAIGFAISLAIELLVDVLGIDSGLATLLVIASAIAIGFQTGYIPADEALKAVSVATSLASQANSAMIGMEMEELASQGEELGEDYLALEEVKDKINNDYLSTDIIRKLRNKRHVAPIETCDEFFYRATRTNPGADLLKRTSTYCSDSLQLPDINGLNALA